jgi:uncharacterized DUF497 family protein
MRFHLDERKSGRLRANPKRGIGFEEVQEVFSHPYYLDQRSDLPEQYRAIGWVGEQLYTVIFEVRENEEGEYYNRDRRAEAEQCRSPEAPGVRAREESLGFAFRAKSPDRATL